MEQKQNDKVCGVCSQIFTHSFGSLWVGKGGEWKQPRSFKYLKERNWHSLGYIANTIPLQAISKTLSQRTETKTQRVSFKSTFLI